MKPLGTPAEGRAAARRGDHDTLARVYAGQLELPEAIAAMAELRDLAGEKRVVLQGVSFEVGEGEVHGIMGPNGAGKTTCFHTLTGRYRPDAGRVAFEGRDVSGLAPRRIARLGIARSFQLMNLFDEYSALENATVATPEFRRGGFGMFTQAWRAGAARDRAAQVLADVGLAGKEDVRAKDLAYGDRRALEIGVALAAAPRLLFLDEPTAGLGAEGTERLRALLGRLRGTADGGAGGCDDGGGDFASSPIKNTSPEPFAPRGNTRCPLAVRRSYFTTFDEIVSDLSRSGRLSTGKSIST